MAFIKRGNIYEDEKTGLTDVTKTGLKASIKRFKLSIPLHEFLSNRYVLEGLEYLEDDS